ncbi:hypothetical protein [Thiomicrorhabdus indica]|uniref:hypothetical protein n=1 Tax=Thiomicrorhabdus indica TaxID=2267253 RepID=UPI00102D8A89|nr:hypothetical protein [Thiomicrorhabdus indica]
MSENSSANGQIPDALKADSASAKPAVKKTPARKPAAKKPQVSTVAKKAAEKETHIADKIKALPRRRVWPD